MECTIDWLAANGMAFSAETGSGHLLTMDGAPDGGGRNLAPRPMETVLAGTGALHRLRRRPDPQARPPRRARLPRQGDARSAPPQDPKVFTQDPPALRRQRPSACRRRRSSARSRCRTRSTARRRSCSAKTAAITTSFELVDGGADALRRSARSSSSPWRRRASPSAPAPAGACAPALLGGHRVARLRRPSSARRSRATRGRRRAAGRGGSSRWCSTWRSVSTTKPRLSASPARPATRPMPNAPAYQSGLSRLGRAPSSRSRSAVQARWSVSSPRGLLELAPQRRVGRGQRLRAVERLGADLADVVDAHQGAGAAPLGVVERRSPERGATGFGRAACGVLVSARKAWSDDRPASGRQERVGTGFMSAARIAVGRAHAPGRNPRCAKTT